MRFRAIVVALPLLVPALVACKKVEPAQYKEQLSSPEQKKRDEAAEQLRKIYATDKKAVGDVGVEGWADRVKRLPDDSREAQAALLKQPLVPKSTSDYRLDDFYAVSVVHDSTGKVTSASAPIRNVAFVDVKPAPGFSGKWVTYYMHGMIRATDDYAAGALKHTREMHENGQLRREADMVVDKNGKVVPNGVVITRDLAGKPEVEETFEAGVLNGPRKQFYPSGKVKTEGTWVKGNTEGLLKGYRADGVLEWCTTYDKGNEVSRGCPK